MRRLLGALVASLVLSSAAPAQDRTVAACQQGEDTAAKITACTQLIEKPGLSKEARAGYFAHRGWAYFQNDDYQRALADLDISAELNPRTFAVFATRASMRKAAGDYAGALADIDRAVRLAPKSAAVRAVRGDILREKGDLDEAIATYAQALTMDRLDIGAYLGLSLAHRAAGHFSEAEAQLSRALALNSRIAEIHVAQGLLAESTGDSDKARAAYERALSLPKSVRISDRIESPIFDSTRQQATARARLTVLDEVRKAGADTGVVRPAAPQGKRLALVIGNGGYRDISRLPNPARDAQLVSRQLTSIGFDVVEGIDLDHQAMRRQLTTFLARAPQSEVALIFYAGHGMQIDGRNYLVPTDARIDDGDLSRALIELDFVLAGLDDKLRANVIVLDACRDNPLAGRPGGLAGRSVQLRAGLAPQSKPAAGGAQGAGTLLAFATAPGQVALDGEGDNSPFSAALARHIGTPGLEIQQMLTRVRAEVVAATKGQQVPWSNSSLLGEVYLSTR